MRTAPDFNGAVVNAMSVDVEDYFQVSAFEGFVRRSAWGNYESRVVRNTERILELFHDNGVQATFFVLGWVADRHPSLVRLIASEGHELASHSYSHRLVYEMTREEFRDDLRRSRDVIEAAAGVRVTGFRAPSFSIVKQSLWGLDVLIEEGFEYDASIFPVHHDRYGIPDAPRHVHRIDRVSGGLWEVPGSTVRVGRVNLPIGGGGYFRLMPYGLTQRAIERLNRIEHQPAVFYLHPWEVDPEQPRLPASMASRFRHYTGLSRTLERLQRLVTSFKFGPVSSLVPAPASVVGV